MKRSIILSIALLAITVGEAHAVPVTTSFAARVADADGPLSGKVALTFRIFTAAQNGTLQWEESHSSVDAREGMVYVQLGSVAPETNGLDERVFTGAPMWLEVTINGELQQPRLAIASVPYAVHAATANKLQGHGPEDFADSEHHHDGRYAPMSHTHSQYAPVSHSHNSSQINAYQDLVDAGQLGTAHHLHILTRGDGDGRYALSSHSHSCTTETTTNWVGSNSTTGPTISCPAGKTMTGGGYAVFGIDGRWQVTASRPSGNGWYARARNTDSVNRQISLWVRCCAM